mmetsp:Transcript_16353/g.57151  ORF Transcript_16353/g.57151 Transcript_16353/m.57151 type:complete len:226 (-) Transcript_16353:737-1414(-)
MPLYLAHTSVRPLSWTFAFQPRPPRLPGARAKLQSRKVNILVNSTSPPGRSEDTNELRPLYFGAASGGTATAAADAWPVGWLAAKTRLVGLRARRRSSPPGSRTSTSHLPCSVALSETTTPNAPLSSGADCNPCNFTCRPAVSALAHAACAASALAPTLGIAWITKPCPWECIHNLAQWASLESVAPCPKTMRPKRARVRATLRTCSSAKIPKPPPPRLTVLSKT